MLIFSIQLSERKHRKTHFPTMSPLELCRLPQATSIHIPRVGKAGRTTDRTIRTKSFFHLQVASDHHRRVPCQHHCGSCWHCRSKDSGWPDSGQSSWKEWLTSALWVSIHVPTCTRDSGPVPRGGPAPEVNNVTPNQSVSTTLVGCQTTGANSPSPEHLDIRWEWRDREYSSGKTRAWHTWLGRSSELPVQIALGPLAPGTWDGTWKIPGSLSKAQSSPEALGPGFPAWV